MANTEPFIIERTYNATQEQVWKAITDAGSMKQWYFDIPDFRPETGHEFSFIGGSEEKKYLHLCKITEVVTGKKISYSWRYDGLPGYTLVTFELFPVEDKTRLRLTHSGLETFASNGKDFQRESFSGGWNALIGTLLRDYLEGSPVN